uniref:BtpA/SgcQ family protein n=1 Tax=Pseudothermotoga hypogea TaxID=57487 RepID=A0A832I903_9THEM
MLPIQLMNKKKFVIGMVHFPACPGFTLYDDNKGIQWILERVRNDLIALQENGIDAVMFCNENDRPYSFQADFATVAVMSRVIGELQSSIRVPFGVDVLWDAKAALAIAKATGASFIREVVTGVYASDMGLWNTNVGELFKYRKLIEANNVAIFFNIMAEFAYSLDRRPIEFVAKSVVFSSMADAVLVSGPMTGQPPEVETVKKVKEVITDVPVIVNTGVREDNVQELLSIADGVIVGTGLKRDGITWNPVDPERVRRFMRKVETLR